MHSRDASPATRNLLLLEESNLAKVSDPAAGSGGIESLTQALCETAWTLFQETEKAGGVFAALEQNLIQRQVAATRAVREANIARRKDELTGATAFPNLNEAQVAVLAVKPSSWHRRTKLNSDSTRCRPYGLPRPLSICATVSDEILKAKGARPRVFLANLGTAADFTARATFARSFFETGGIEAIGSDGFADAATLSAAFKASGARLACICFVRQGLCRARGRCREGPSNGRRQTYLSRRARRASRSKPCVRPASTSSSLPAATR